MYANNRTNRVGNAFRMRAGTDTFSQLPRRKVPISSAKLGGHKAVKAMARVLACLYYRLVMKGQRWVDQGIEEFNRRSEQRELPSCQRQSSQARNATRTNCLKEDYSTETFVSCC